METIEDKKLRMAGHLEAMELVECIRARALKALSDEDAYRIIQSLNAFEEPRRERPDWSGLVEQQAIFHRRKQ